MLHELLERLGLKFDQLTEEEKKTYQSWSTILTAPEVTLDGVKKLIASEHNRAHDELQKLDNSKDRDLYFKVLARLTAILQLFIETPATQRDALRTHLKEVFHIDI